MEAPSEEIIRVERLEIRPSQYVVLAAGRTLPLSVRELHLLAALARRPDRIISREELYQTVWGTPMRSTDRSVDVYVHKVRTKLASALPDTQFIHTHFGFGYRFAPEPSPHFHTSATSR